MGLGWGWEMVCRVLGLVFVSVVVAVWWNASFALLFFLSLSLSFFYASDGLPGWGVNFCFSAQIEYLAESEDGERMDVEQRDRYVGEVICENITLWAIQYIKPGRRSVWGREDGKRRANVTLTLRLCQGFVSRQSTYLRYMYGVYLP